MARGAEAVFEGLVEEGEVEVVDAQTAVLAEAVDIDEFDFGSEAECARKAARKLEKKGRLLPIVDMVGQVLKVVVRTVVFGQVVMMMMARRSLVRWDMRSILGNFLLSPGLWMRKICRCGLSDVWVVWTSSHSSVTSETSRCISLGGCD